MKVIFGKNLFKWSKVDKAKHTRLSSGNILKIKRLGIYGFVKVIRGRVNNYPQCMFHIYKNKGRDLTTT